MVIWKDIDVPIREKVVHVHSIGGKLHRDFCNSYGDLPVARFNEETDKFEDAVNLRGRAYAARKRLKYRKKN